MIELKNISKKYHSDLFAVDDVSFSLPIGSITCLIGKSGSGKTTVLKLINRLIEPSSGDIFLHGKNIKELDPIKLRQSIGYVIQDVGLLPHLTIEKNIWIVQEVNRVPKNDYRSRCYKLMQLVGLEPDIYAKRYPTELSGGERQRVGIARALMNDPPVLLMDEPFGALDPVTRSRLQDELLELNQSLHKTILIVTHDLQEGFKLGDELVLFRDGKVIQKGSKEEFQKHPADSEVEEFVKVQTE